MYSDDLRSLFHSVDEDEYKKKLEDIMGEWDSVFEQYYMNEIHPDVSFSIGRWVLEKYSVYNPYSGITNNQSESFNRYIVWYVYVLQ